LLNPFQINNFGLRGALAKAVPYQPEEWMRYMMKGETIDNQYIFVTSTNEMFFRVKRRLAN